MKFDGADVYPVGLFSDYRRGRVRYGLRKYVWPQIKRRNWRAVRNHFNGYLAEHDNHPHDCGRGWTKRAAKRRVERLCARVVPAAVSGASTEGSDQR